MALRNYEKERIKKAKKERAANPSSVSTGVACTDMMCGYCHKHHHIRDLPVGSRKERQSWQKKHRHTIPCDGEMMWTEPRKKHPELRELARAICGKCGWKGWI